MSLIDSTYWTEKYRPNTLDNGLILNENMRKTFEEYIKNQEFPHLMFVGPPGTGKTTLAITLIRQIIKSDVDVLHINGSVDTGVDNIRDRIMAFLGTPPSKSNIKIVFIDEADFLSSAAFAALRATIEQPAYNKNLKTRFIFCANYINKIPDPMLSRFTVFTLKALPREDMITKCKEILNIENITYDDDTLNLIIDQNYPDMRSVIKTLQVSCINNTLQYNSYNSIDGIGLINEIEKMLNVSHFSESYEQLAHCRELITDDIDITFIIQQLMDKFVVFPMCQALIYRYYLTLSLVPNQKYTLVSLLSELVITKYGFFL